jgi:transcriptional regulator with XRE-family HTH domain
MVRLANSIDQHVGARVRMRRLMVGMSQAKLGNALQVSSKQVQKYEKGANRIGAGRLQEIARLLRVPLAFFFDGAPGGDEPAPGFAEPGAGSSVAFVMTSDGMHLNRAFASIRDPDVRRKFLLLVESLAEAPQRPSVEDSRHDEEPLSEQLAYKVEEELIR